jgi:hypothetical protein
MKGLRRLFKMGQRSPSPEDESDPTESLHSRAIEDLAKYIKDGKAKNIVVMVSFIVASSQSQQHSS